jgi:hypothetical protein
MAEQSNEKRKPRLRRIREMLERCFRHGLILMQELVREPRPLWVDGENGEEEQIAWKGNMIAGQVNVRIDAEPDIDSDTLKTQTIQDMMKLAGPALAQQWMQDKRFARFVTKAMGAPVEEMFQRQKLQTDEAEREYVEFMRSGKIPVVDPELDDHEEHHDCHGIDQLSEKFRTLADKAGLDEALPFLTGWEQQMAPVQGPASMIQTPQGAMVQPGPMMPSPMMAALAQSQVPPALQDQILAVWKLMLMERQIEVGPELEQVLTFRAHSAVHKKYASGELQAAQGGAPVMAAPGADQTAGGTIPTAGAPPQEQGMVQ